MGSFTPFASYLFVGISSCGGGESGEEKGRGRGEGRGRREGGERERQRQKSRGKKREAKIEKRKARVEKREARKDGGRRAVPDTLVGYSRSKDGHRNVRDALRFICFQPFNL